MKPRHKPKSRAARGYGRDHVRLSKAWARKIKAGGVVCWRCGQTIEPGAKWHLGHDDDDRTSYRGPEHPLCNLRAAGRKAQALRRRASLATSRAW